MTDHTSAVERLVAEWEAASESIYPRGYERHALPPDTRYEREGRGEQLEECAKALAAAIQQDKDRAGVAVAHVLRIDTPQSALVGLYDDTLKAGDQLYTRPAQPAEVSDAMVERARDAKLPNGDRVHQHITTVWERTVLTAALTAALRLPDEQAGGGA